METSWRMYMQTQEKRYIQFTATKDKEDKYEQEIRNGREELNRTEEQRKKDCQTKRTPKMKLRSQGHVHDDYLKGLDYSRKRIQIHRKN